MTDWQTKRDRQKCGEDRREIISLICGKSVQGAFPNLHLHFTCSCKQITFHFLLKEGPCHDFLPHFPNILFYTSLLPSSYFPFFLFPHSSSSFHFHFYSILRSLTFVLPFSFFSNLRTFTFISFSSFLLPTSIFIFSISYFFFLRSPSSQFHCLFTFIFTFSFPFLFLPTFTFIFPFPSSLSTFIPIFTAFLSRRTHDIIQLRRYYLVMTHVPTRTPRMIYPWAPTSTRDRTSLRLILYRQISLASDLHGDFHAREPIDMREEVCNRGKGEGRGEVGRGKGSPRPLEQTSGDDSSDVRNRRRDASADSRGPSAAFVT